MNLHAPRVAAGAQEPLRLVVPAHEEPADLVDPADPWHEEADLPAAEEPAVSEPSDAPTLRVLELGDALEHEDEPIPWEVTDWLAKGDRCVLGGEFGLGKSILALDLTFALATGDMFLGDLPISGPRRVLYADEENPERLIRHRVRKLSKGRGLTAEQVRELPIRYLIGNRLNLSQDERLQVLFREVQTFKPDWIVLDSLIRFHGCEENSNSEMARFLREAIEPLSQHYGCGVVMLHHLAKPAQGKGNGNGSRELIHRLRGAGDIVGFVDTAWGLGRGREEDSEKGKLVLSHLKGRWAESPGSLTITLTDGDNNTALTLSAVETEEQALRIIQDELSARGAEGALRSELVGSLEAEGLKSADRLTTRHLGRMQATGRTRKRKEGHSVRYWLAHRAPEDAEGRTEQ